MAERITSPLLRFRFVEKEPADVGDGKLHCMRATAAQLAEVMYRVRDSKWVSGTATQRADDGGSGIYEAVVTFTAAAPAAKVEWKLQAGAADGAYTRRAYAAVTNDETPDQPMEDYSDDDFSEVAYLTVGGINGDTTYPIAWREALRERALLANAFPEVDPNQTGFYEAAENIDDTYLGSAPNDQFKTGFSFFGASWTVSFVEPTIYAPFSTFEDVAGMTSPVPYYQGLVEIVFNGEVAWVDVNNSGNPLDSANELYIGVEFRVINSFDGTSGNYSHSTNLDTLAAPKSGKLADLKLKLSGVDNFITAAIYGWEECIFGSCVASATDWIFEPTAYLPAAKGSPAAPVWNTATGEKLA